MRCSMVPLVRWSSNQVLSSYNLPMFIVAVISDHPRMERYLSNWQIHPWPSLSIKSEVVDHWSSWLKPSPLEHAAVHIFICDLLIFSSWMKDYLGLPSVKKQGCLIEKENLFPPFAVKCSHVVNHFKKQWSGTLLVVQKLRLHAPSAGGLGSIPGWGTGGTKIPHDWSKAWWRRR